MMKSEFIERTGFEPTASEYKEIEQEYMGCDIDKDKFCKEWVKNGGIQRLSRQRARKIEELEDQIRIQETEHESRIGCLLNQLRALEGDNKTRQETIDYLEETIKAEINKRIEAEKNLESVQYDMAQLIDALKTVNSFMNRRAEG